MIQKDCNFSESSKDKLSDINLIVNQMQSTLKEITKLIEKTTNTELKNDIYKLTKLFENFTSATIQTKMSALSTVLDSVNEELTEVFNDLKNRIDLVIKNQDEYLGLANKIKSAIDQIEQIKCNDCFEKVEKIYNKMFPAKKEKDIKFFLNYFSKNFWKIFIVFCFLCLFILSLFGKFNMDNFIKETIDDKTKIIKKVK